MVIVHDPIILSKVAYLADDGSIVIHNCFGHLPGGHIYTVGRARANQRLQYNKVVPKLFGRTSPNHHLGNTSLKLPDTAFSSLHPRRVGFCLLQVAICFIKFAFELAENLFL